MSTLPPLLLPRTVCLTGEFPEIRLFDFSLNSFRSIDSSYPMCNRIRFVDSDSTHTRVVVSEFDEGLDAHCVSLLNLDSTTSVRLSTSIRSQGEINGLHVYDSSCILVGDHLRHPFDCFLWNLDTHAFQRIRGSRGIGGVYSFASLPLFDRIYAGGIEPTILEFNPETETSSLIPLCEIPSLWALYSNPVDNNNNRLYFASRSKKIGICDIRTQSVVSSLSLEFAATALCCDTERHHICVGGEMHNQIDIFDERFLKNDPFKIIDGVGSAGVVVWDIVQLQSYPCPVFGCALGNHIQGTGGIVVWDTLPEDEEKLRAIHEVGKQCYGVCPLFSVQEVLEEERNLISVGEVEARLEFLCFVAEFVFRSDMSSHSECEGLTLGWLSWMQE